MMIPFLRTTLNVEPSDRATAHVASVASFVTGVLFMMIYYRMFHVTKTGQQTVTDSLSKERRKRQTWQIFLWPSLFGSGANLGRSIVFILFE